MAMSALGQESPAAKAARLLRETEINTTKIDDTTWSMPFEGKSMKNIDVLAGVGDGILVTFARIPESKKVKFTPAVLLKLLKLNDQYDGVKVGIDDDEIVFVRIDLTVRTLDKDQLTAGIDQVAAAVDLVHAEIKPFLPKAK